MFAKLSVPEFHGFLRKNVCPIHTHRHTHPPTHPFTHTDTHTHKIRIYTHAFTHVRKNRHTKHECQAKGDRYDEATDAMYSSALNHWLLVFD